MDFFAIHGVDETGKPVLVLLDVKRAALLELIAKLPPCLIGVTAFSGAHHWAQVELPRVPKAVRWKTLGAVNTLHLLDESLKHLVSRA